MQQKLIPDNFQTLTFWLRDFLASLSVLLEKEKVLTMQEERSFLMSQGFVPKKNQNMWFLKTLKVYYLMKGAELSKQSLGFLPTWGISLNGRFLTAKILESPKIGKECSLSDILEKNPDQKYFLSERTIKKILNQTKQKNDFKCALITRNKYRGNYIKQLNKPTHSNYRVYAEEGISPTLNTMQGGMRQPFIALTKKRTNEIKIRRLTPLECERLQGFPDQWTKGFSDTQRYKMMGNAVTVNVVAEIIKKLFS